MMLRAFDLSWRIGRRLGGNAQHQRASGRFGFFTATFLGVHRKAPTATFFGVQDQSALGYVSRGDWLHFSGLTATFFAVNGYVPRGSLEEIGYIFRGSTARLNLPFPAPLALTPSS